MAINTYATLKTAITYWLDITATDLTNQIDDLVTLGEKRIHREARTSDNEATLTTSISSGTVALPSDYVEMRYCYVNTSPVQILQRRQPEWIYENYPTRSGGGKPLFFAREAGNLIFGPYPDSTYAINGIYYKRAGTLSSATYNLFLNNPDLYLFACLAESEIIIGRDNRVALWEAKYQKVLGMVNGEAKNEYVSGSAPQIRVA